MNKIEQLIQQYCPNGVEFKELGEVANITIGEFVHKNKQDANAKYPVYNGGISYTGFYDEFNNTANKIVMSARGAYAGFVNKLLVDYWAGNSSYSISIKNSNLLNWHFFFYLLKDSQSKFINEQQNGGIPAVSKKQFEKFQIPIPPLPIQQEIVKILDSFTQLEAELEAELEARRAQYEYYRNKLLSATEVSGKWLMNGVEVEWRTLGEVCKFSNGKGHEKSIVEHGKYVVVNSKFVSTEGKVKKFSNTQISPIYKEDVLMVMSDLPNGKALAKCFIVNEDDKYTLNQRICSLTVKNKQLLCAKFLFYVSNRNEQLLRYDNGADQTNLRKDDILDISIPVPAIDTQKKIVEILDRFDTLCNDISIGLPAEIDGRRKQYNYYRGKLLDFKCISNG